MKTALISVYDKTGIVEFTQSLVECGFAIVSTGGTAKLLADNGIEVTEVSDYTGFPEMMDGRVKTLHPKIHGGILALRANKDHMKAAEDNSIKMIDMVVSNLYPFEETIQKADVELKVAIENIDVGGPTLVRAAAKNYEHVAVIVNPDEYPVVIDELKKDGAISKALRQRLASQAFEHTARYDALITGFLNERFMLGKFPQHIILPFDKIQELRYGENPYQQGAFYKEPFSHESSVSSSKQLHGKELSYNNILDINEAFELVKDFEKPTAAIIKHTNPCGVGTAGTIEEAYVKARESDPKSAFGSIVALNCDCNKKVAEEINQSFVEVVVCPTFDDDAVAVLTQKKYIRLIATGGVTKSDEGLEYKRIADGLLAQTRNFPEFDVTKCKVVTARAPTADELKALEFAFLVNKHVKSNGIVFSKTDVTVGIGAGQMSRVDAVEIAAKKGGDRCKGAVMSSDAFFPFRDGVDAAAKAGVTAVIHPGGSIRDEEVIKAADEHNMAMVFSDIRLFKH